MIAQGDIYGILGVYGYVLSVLVLAGFLKQRIGNPRKLVHILIGGITFIWWSFESDLVMAFLAALPFVPLLMLATPISPLKRLTGSPLGRISSEGHEYGLVMYAISWTLIAYFLFDDLFIASVAIAAMSFGDGAGGLIGGRFGKRAYLPNRTVEGSLTIFGATAASVLVLGWFYLHFLGYEGITDPGPILIFSLVVAGFVTSLEAVTPGSVDNLVIPLAVAGYIHALGVIG